MPWNGIIQQLEHVNTLTRRHCKYNTIAFPKMEDFQRNYIGWQTIHSWHGPSLKLVLSENLHEISIRYTSSVCSRLHLFTILSSHLNFDYRIIGLRHSVCSSCSGKAIGAFGCSHRAHRNTENYYTVAHKMNSNRFYDLCVLFYCFAECESFAGAK